MSKIEEDKEAQLRTKLKEHGYDLYAVVHFKTFDRIRFGNDSITMAINLRGKLSELALDTLIKACIR